MTLKMNQGEIKIFRTRCVPLRLTRDGNPPIFNGGNK